jgi:hypothetical protein
MVVLLSVAGTLLILAGLFALKLCFSAWRNLAVSTQVIEEAVPILEAFYQQQAEALKAMGMDDESEEGGFGLNQ